MTLWYGAILALFVIVFAGVVYLEASRVLWNAAAERVVGVAQEIDSFVRAEANDPFGPVSAISALADQTTLDTFVGPGLFVEVFNSAGYRVDRTTNLGEADLPRSGDRGWRAPYGFGGEWSTAATSAGPVLERVSTLRTNGADTPMLTVVVAASLNGVYDEERNFAIFLAISVVLALGAVVAASAWLARTTVSPINAIARAARDIGGEDLAKRLNWQERGDELGMLAKTFDEMLSRLEAAFARERRLIADASHELKTPLTVINANAQMLERWADRDEGVRRESIAAIRAESANMARVLNAMLTLAKTDDPRALAMEPTDLSALVREAANGLRPAAEEKGLTLDVQTDGSAIVLGEPGLLRQLVTNLTENAIKFTSAGGVRVSLARDGRSARIVVSDTGRGIPAEALPHVFERFYRADPARSRAVEGTGLGLAVVRNIVRVHSGEIAVRSDPGRGTTFTVDIPIVAGADEPAA